MFKTFIETMLSETDEQFYSDLPLHSIAISDLMTKESLFFEVLKTRLITVFKFFYFRTKNGKRYLKNIG